MAVLMAAAALWGALQLFTLAWPTRSVRLSTLLLALTLGIYGCGTATALIEVAYTPVRGPVRPPAGRGREHHQLHRGALGGGTPQVEPAVAGRPVCQGAPPVGADRLRGARFRGRCRVRTAGGVAAVRRRGQASDPAPGRWLGDSRRLLPALCAGPEPGVHQLVTGPVCHRRDGTGFGFGDVLAPGVDGHGRPGRWRAGARPRLAAPAVSRADRGRCRLSHAQQLRSPAQ